jgi:hypothetical protein
VSRFDRRNRGGDGVGDRGGAYRETRASGSPPRDAIPGLVASCSGWWRAGDGGGGGAGGRKSAGAEGGRAGGRACSAALRARACPPTLELGMPWCARLLRRDETTGATPRQGTSPRARGVRCGGPEEAWTRCGWGPTAQQ